MCISEDFFRLFQMLYLFAIFILFMGLFFLTFLKVDKLATRFLSKITGITIWAEPGRRWKVQNLQGWQRAITEFFLCLFWEIPILLITSIVGFFTFAFLLTAFIAPYTQLCYGYP